MGDDIFMSYFDELYDDYGKDETLSPLNEEFCKTLAREIISSKNVLFLTGAGISVSAGIPDFRSNEGIWKKYDPSVYGTLTGFLAHPQNFWKMGMELHSSIEDKVPTKTHSAITKLQKFGKLGHIITQNVDGLHQVSGSLNVTEIHGNTRRCKCIDCGFVQSCSEILKKYPQPWLDVPHCPQCAGLMKLDVVLFGEELNKPYFDETLDLVKKCDLLIIVGSSLEVNPVNMFPLIAQMNKAKVALVNLTETKCDDLCDYVIRGESDVLIPKIVDYVDQMMNGKELSIFQQVKNVFTFQSGVLKYVKKIYEFTRDCVCGVLDIGIKQVQLFLDEMKQNLPKLLKDD